MSRRIRKIAILLIISMFAMMIAGCSSNKSISADSFYYDQLTEFEKSIYRNLEAGKDAFIKGEKVECYRADNSEEIIKMLDAEHYKMAFDAYMLDNPMAMLWCNINYLALSMECEEVVQEGKKIHQDALYLIPVENKEIISAFDTSEELKVAITEIEKTAQEFINTLEGTNHEKIRAIHDWMLEGTVYGENKHAQDVYGSLVKKEAICYGFAHGFKYLCDIAGINAINVIGEKHIWNYVQDDDGRWYLVDVTWDLDTGLKYFLTEINTEMTSGEREYNDEFDFSYEFFHEQ